MFIPASVAQVSSRVCSAADNMGGATASHFLLSPAVGGLSSVMEGWICWGVGHGALLQGVASFTASSSVVWTFWLSLRRISFLSLYIKKQKQKKKKVINYSINCSLILMAFHTSKYAFPTCTPDVSALRESSFIGELGPDEIYQKRKYISIAWPFKQTQQRWFNQCDGD